MKFLLEDTAENISFTPDDLKSKSLAELTDLYQSIKSKPFTKEWYDFLQVWFEKRYGSKYNNLVYTYPILQQWISKNGIEPKNNPFLAYVDKISKTSISPTETSLKSIDNAIRNEYLDGKRIEKYDFLYDPKVYAQKPQDMQYTMDAMIFANNPKELRRYGLPKDIANKFFDESGNIKGADEIYSILNQYQSKDELTFEEVFEDNNKKRKEENKQPQSAVDYIKELFKQYDGNDKDILSADIADLKEDSELLKRILGTDVEDDSDADMLKALIRVLRTTYSQKDKEVPLTGRELLIAFTNKARAKYNLPAIRNLSMETIYTYISKLAKKVVDAKIYPNLSTYIGILINKDDIDTTLSKILSTKYQPSGAKGEDAIKLLNHDLINYINNKLILDMNDILKDRKKKRKK